MAYYADAMKKGYQQGDFSTPGMFTAVGKPRMKTGKYNVPVGLYSDETLLELASSGGHGFVEYVELGTDPLKILERIFNATLFSNILIG